MRAKEPMRRQLSRNELARILQDSHSSGKILKDNQYLSPRVLFKSKTKNAGFML